MFNYLRGNGPTGFRFCAIFGALAIGGQAMAQSLYVNGLNQTTWTGTIVNSGLGIDVDAYIGSLNGTLWSGNGETGTPTALGEFYCIDITHDIGVPTQYNVNIDPNGASDPNDPHAQNIGEAAWLIAAFSPNYDSANPGLGVLYNGFVSANPGILDGTALQNKQEMDAALQLAIWETVFPGTTGPSGALSTLAGEMMTEDAGRSITGYVMLAENNEPPGQSMLYVPGGGGGNFSVTPEPVTIALSIAGLGLAVRRRRMASK